MTHFTHGWNSTIILAWNGWTRVQADSVLNRSMILSFFYSLPISFIFIWLWPLLVNTFAQQRWINLVLSIDDSLTRITGVSHFRGMKSVRVPPYSIDPIRMVSCFCCPWHYSRDQARILNSDHPIGFWTKSRKIPSVGTVPTTYDNLSLSTGGDIVAIIGP